MYGLPTTRAFICCTFGLEGEMARHPETWDGGYSPVESTYMRGRV